MPNQITRHTLVLRVGQESQLEFRASSSIIRGPLKVESKGRKLYFSVAGVELRKGVSIHLLEQLFVGKRGGGLRSTSMLREYKLKD